MSLSMFALKGTRALRGDEEAKKKMKYKGDEEEESDAKKRMKRKGDDDDDLELFDEDESDEDDEDESDLVGLAIEEYAEEALGEMPNEDDTESRESVHPEPTGEDIQSATEGGTSAVETAEALGELAEQMEAASDAAHSGDAEELADALAAVDETMAALALAAEEEATYLEDEEALDEEDEDGKREKGAVLAKWASKMLDLG